MIYDVLLYNKSRIIDQEEKVEGKKYNGYRLIGHIDFSTMIGKVGIIELKSIKSFFQLPYMPGSGTAVERKKYDKKEKKVITYTIDFGPYYTHVDQLLLYLLLSKRTVGTLVYISKTYGDGILPFIIRIGREGLKYVDNRVAELANEYTEALVKYFNDTRLPKDYSEVLTSEEARENIKNIVKKIRAFPTTHCQSCIYGGFRYWRGVHLRPKGVTYPNLCEIDHFYRKYVKSVMAKWKYGKPTEYPKIPSLEIKYSKEFHDRLNKEIIEYIADNINWKDSIYNLFGCPRKSNYYSNMDIKKVFLYDKRNTNIGIWVWRQRELSEYLCEIFDPGYSEIPISVTLNGKKFVGETYRIDGTITKIAPTAKITYKKLSTFPVAEHLLECALIQYLTGEKPIRLIYYGIRTTNSLAFDVEVKEKYMRPIIDSIEDSVSMIENNVPIPSDYCGWCPFVNYRDAQGNLLCPEGYNYWTKGSETQTEKEAEKISTLYNILCGNYKYKKAVINNKQYDLLAYDYSPIIDTFEDEE